MGWLQNVASNFRERMTQFTQKYTTAVEPYVEDLEEGSSLAILNILYDHIDDSQEWYSKFSLDCEHRSASIEANQLQYCYDEQSALVERSIQLEKIECQEWYSKFSLFCEQQSNCLSESIDANQLQYCYDYAEQLRLQPSASIEANQQLQHFSLPRSDYMAM